MPHVPETKPGPLRRALASGMARFVFALLGASLLGLLVVVVWLSVRVDASMVQSRLEEALRDPLDEPEVTVGEAGLKLFPPGIEATQIRVREPDRSLLLLVRRAEIQGLSLRALAGGELQGREILLVEPHLRYVAPTAGSTNSGSELDSATVAAPAGRRRNVLSHLDRFPARRLVIREGRFLVHHRGTPRGRDLGGHVALWGLDADLGVRLNATACGLRKLSADGLTLLTLDSLSVSSTDSTLRVRSIRFSPTVPDVVFLRERRTRTRLSVTTGAIVLSGLEAGDLIAGDSWSGGALVAHTPRAEILVDKRVPVRSNEETWRPADGVRVLDRRLELDRVGVREGSLRYAETPPGGSSTGEIWFDSVSGEARVAGADSTGIHVEASALLQGAARLRTRLRLDTRARPLDISTWTGSVGPPRRGDGIDLRAFNQMLIPQEGVRLTSGRADSLWFEARVTGGRATGFLTAEYRDLEYRLVSKETGEQGLGSWIKSLFAPGLPSRNPPEPGAALRSGRVESRIEPTQPFFGFVWASLRSGLVSLLGL